MSSRTAALKGDTTAEDGEVFGLVEEWWQQLKSEHAALTRILEATQPLLPPGLQTTEDALFLAETRRGLGDRLAETPANTLEGINAKLHVAMKSGRNTEIARSAATDLARLVGGA